MTLDPKPDREEILLNQRDAETLLNYATPEPLKMRGLIAGRLAGQFSLACTIFGLVGIIVPIIIVPLAAIAFITGILATVLTRGRSIAGWIGLTISGFFVCVFVWALLTGR